MFVAIRSRSISVSLSGWYWNSGKEALSRLESLESTSCLRSHRLPLRAHGSTWRLDQVSRSNLKRNQQKKVFAFQWTQDDASSTPIPNILSGLLQGDGGLSSWTAYGLPSWSALERFWCKQTFRKYLRQLQIRLSRILAKVRSEKVSGEHVRRSMSPYTQCTPTSYVRPIEKGIVRTKIVNGQMWCKQCPKKEAFAERRGAGKIVRGRLLTCHWQTPKNSVLRQLSDEIMSVHFWPDSFCKTLVSCMFFDFWLATPVKHDVCHICESSFCSCWCLHPVDVMILLFICRRPLLRPSQSLGQTSLCSYSARERWVHDCKRYIYICDFSFFYLLLSL